MGSPPVKGFGQSDPALAAWAELTYAPEDAVLREIRERSDAAGLPRIAVGRMDGLHLEVLARAAGVRRAVEIGTLGGYSGVCLARALPPGGLLHTFELEPGHAEVARRSFERAGVAERVRVHVGPALERLREIERDGPFDLVFVDADKRGYPAYLAWAEVHLRVGGLLLADNTFGFGHVHEEEREASSQGAEGAPSPSALHRAAGAPPRSGASEDPAAMAALRAFSERLAQGGRFRATILPTAEGLSVGVRIR